MLMNHQVFITNTNSALKTYFDKVEKEYESEKSSLRHELNKKDEIIKNLHNTITTNEKEIRRLSINEKKLMYDTSDAIEFNSSFSEEIKENKSRSFWNLLKIE